MLETSKTTYIQDLQCKQGCIAEKLETALAYGGCNATSLIRRNNVLSHLINVLYRYTGFAGQVWLAEKVELEIDVDSGAITIDIDYGATNIASFSGDASTEDLDDILDELVADINDNTTSPDFSASRAGDVLYVWSTDVATDGSDLTYTTSNITETVTTIDDEPEEILTSDNCLTGEQICKIVKFAYKQVGTDCNC